MELRTIRDVPIVSTGVYSLDSGTTEFTAEHLADAVRATTDETVVAPRLKLGHTSKLNEVLGDGEPAFGQARNLRLSDDGQTIIADYENVPAWLADSMSAHYPGRSIEGGFDFKAPSGHEYKLVISDVALLGTEWPGVTSLADLQQVVSANGRIETPVKVDSGDGFKLAGGQAQSLVAAKLSPEPSITAALDVGNFRSVFAKDLRAGRIPKFVDAGDQTRWWPRSVEAGDDGSLSLTIDDAAGKLISLPVKVNGEGLSYGEPSIRHAVAASASTGPRVLASWPSRDASPSNEGAEGMKREEMLKRLGLAEDATDEAIVNAMAEKPTALAGDSEAPGDGDGGDAGDGEEAVSTEGAELVTASGKKIKLAEGMVIVDKSTLDEVRAGAADGRRVAARLALEERDKAITAALTEGKFSVGRREHYENSWDKDPEGTREIIASLAPGLVPVSEIGRAGDGDGQQGNEEALMQAMYARHFPELVKTGTEA